MSSADSTIPHDRAGADAPQDGHATAPSHIERLESTIARLETEVQDLRGLSHMIRHDVGNSLNAILATCVALRYLEDSLPLPVRSAMADVHGLVHRIEATIDGFLSIVDADSRSGSTQEVDLAAIVDETITHVAGLFPDVSAQIETDLGAEARHVVAHPEHLRRIVENLASNAYKYLDPNRLPLVLKVRSRRVGSEIEIEVEDNGLGIPADRQASVFDLFTRAHPEHPTRQGRGVGLAIARRLVEAGGGSISVWSCPGVGSTFLVRLPAPAS